MCFEDSLMNDVPKVNLKVPLHLMVASHQSSIAPAISVTTVASRGIACEMYTLARRRR